MTRTSDLLAVLNRNAIVLVVEDRLTKEYLLAAWGVDQKHFEIVVAGGHSVVKGCVENFRRHGATHVFGLIDKDFGVTNRARWNVPQDPPIILRCERHEIENYLLDWNALAGGALNSHHHDAASIEGWATAEAGKQVFWLACRKVLRDFQQRIGDTFPAEPKMVNVNTADEAENYIVSQPWMQTLQTRSTEICDRGRLHAEIETAVNGYNTALNNATWRVEFSGKEIYRPLMSRIYGVPKTATATPEIDLAISVAEWQVANGHVPAEITELCVALKRRVGITT